MKPVLPIASAFCSACALVCLALYLTSCTPKPTPGPAPAKVNGVPAVKADVSQGRGADFADMAITPVFPVVYFDFNSARIHLEDLDRLSSAVRDARAMWSCYVDGHASSEGTEGYNMALGARRASVVGDYLARMPGVAVIETSYGEERPAATLELSRRVEIRCE